MALAYTLSSLRRDENDGGHFELLAVSSDRDTLMSVMRDDLSGYGKPAVLSHREETEHSSRFVFEGADAGVSDLYLEYMLSRVPAYTRMRGGAAA